MIIQGWLNTGNYFSVKSRSLCLGMKCLGGSAASKVMARSRYRIFENETPYFLTGTVVAWLPVFAYPQFAGVIIESWKFLQEQRGVHIYGYICMENHIHWIASARNLSEQVRSFKSYTARIILDVLEKEGFTTVLNELSYFKMQHKVEQKFQLWQEGNHPQEILDKYMMLQKLEYIHQNPVRRGYVNKPEDWRYSSARNYDGGACLMNVTTQW